MTVSELKYLIAANELREGDSGVKMTAVAQRLGVSKVSVYRGMERLAGSGYVTRSEKRIVLTEKGKEALAEYAVIIKFVRSHLQYHCGTPEDVAYSDAIGCACAFSDCSRKGVAEFVKSGKKDR